MKKEPPYGWIAVALVLLSIFGVVVVVARDKAAARRIDGGTQIQNRSTEFQRELNRKYGQ